jgi:UDP-3-O-[3-hydroxymyristoyl] glucosamine N-acyltransferase
MRLNEIARLLSCQIEAEDDIEILGIETLENARKGQLSFLTNKKYIPKAKTTQASALIVDLDCPKLAIPLLRNKNAYYTFAKAIELFFPDTKKSPVIHPTSIISDKAKVGKNLYIGPFSYVSDDVEIGDNVIIESHCAIHENVRIGDNTIIHSGAVLREGTSIGKDCIIQSNSVIGADGFGYANQDIGGWYKIKQTGKVILEDKVEIGASTTVDKATLGITYIQKGTKIDNLVHIGHGCKIGNDTLLCAQVGLAGSTQVGNNVILAGQVGAGGHLSIGDNVIAIAQTGIPHSIESGRTISGSPAMDQKQWLKSSAIIPKLPGIIKTVRDLQKRLDKLDKTLK